MQTILLTGASGFVGRHLRAALAAGLPGATILTPALDLTDPASVDRAVSETRPDACVHLAAVAAIGVARDDPRTAWAVNLDGTLTLARALRAHAPGALMLHVSSADAYGATFRSGLALDESAAFAPLNTYGATKAAADLALGALAAEWGEGPRIIRLRPFNHTGPGQGGDFAVPAFARQLAAIAHGRQAPVLRVGNLDAARDFLDVRDVCDAYVAVLRDGAGLAHGSVLNVASGIPRRIGEVLDRLIGLSGLAVRIETDPARLRPSDIPIAVGDATRARALLGWAPRIPWDQTLRDVLDDALAQHSAG